MGRLAIPLLALALLGAACGPTAVQTTTTSIPTTAGPSTTGTPPATAPAATTTTPNPTGNPWASLLGEVASPREWTVEPCGEEAPLLCVTHDGTTSTVRLENTPLEGSEFAALLREVGAPPETTDLGAAAGLPFIRGALRALADRQYSDYAESMREAFPDLTAVFEPPAVEAVGRLTGYRFGMRIEDADANLIAWSIHHVAFDGETLWEVTATFDPRDLESGFADLVTLQEMDPYLTQMMRRLALNPTLPGTREITMALPAVGDLGPVWDELFAIPYGEATESLGTSPGGDGGTLNLGPEFGTQAHDGSWWFLDGAKKRLAHYSSEGSFLDAFDLPADFLVRGELFQWQLPHALDDGVLVASRLGFGDTTLLIFRDGSFSTETVAESANVKIDDGAAVYGLAKNGEAVRIEPSTGAVETVDWFVTRGGTRFQLWVSGNVMTLWLPDAPVPNIYEFRFMFEPDPADGVFLGLEAAGGNDGAIYLYLLGGTDSGAGGQLGGFLTVSAQGTVAPIEVTRGPDVHSDPGSPAHLGTNPVTGHPWLMFVDEDGVRVFVRAHG